MRLAHAMAIENDHISADMVETTEFPQLAIQYNIRGVPKTIINETAAIEGSLPEDSFVEEVLKAIKSKG